MIFGICYLLDSCKLKQRIRILYYLVWVLSARLDIFYFREISPRWRFVKYWYLVARLMPRWGKELINLVLCKFHHGGDLKKTLAQFVTLFVWIKVTLIWPWFGILLVQFESRWRFAWHCLKFLFWLDLGFLGVEGKLFFIKC